MIQCNWFKLEKDICGSPVPHNCNGTIHMDNRYAAKAADWKYKG